MSDSNSKGSFFFLPKKQASAKHTGRKKGSERAPFEPLLEGKESSKATQVRYEDYVKAIQCLEKKVENFLLTVNESAISDLCDFVINTYDKGEISKLNPPNRFYALPTALMFTGADKEENTKFFQRVSQKLQQSHQNHIVFLNSMDCSDLKRTEMQVVRQFFGREAIDKDDDNDNDDRQDDYQEDYEASDYSIDPIEDIVDMNTLSQWYEYNYQIKDGPRPLPRLIIIIQDFECFVPEVLENFIYSCRYTNSHYRDRIPIVLLLGITTCIRGIDPLRENYSYSVVRLLKPEAFYLRTQKARCDDLVSQCMIEDAQCIKVGEKAYEFLLDMFIGRKFSLSLFVSSLKYALMHYFYTNPLSILATIEPEEIYSRLDLLNENHVEMIRMQVSFREYVESKLHQPAEARRLLCDDYYVKSLLPTFSQNIATYHQRFAIALEFIIFLQEFLDYDAKKLKLKYELYSIALKKPGLGENDYIQTLLDDLIKIDPKKIGELLQVFISLLKTVLNHVENIEQEYEDFCHFLVRTKEIENDLTRPSTSTRSSITKMKNKESGILQKIEKIGDDYKKLVIDVTNYLAIFFDENLRHYSTNALFEIFYYQEDISILECAFIPKLRSAIHTALGLTTEYINCNCCMDDESNDKDDVDWDSREQILSTHNDTSILYKLHLQCGKLINVRDWLDSFENVIAKENLENRKLNEKEVVARFIKGFEELKLIGIIGSTSRKTDHFKRLSWGKL